jgi:hypothetical protein
MLNFVETDAHIKKLYDCPSLDLPINNSSGEISYRACKVIISVSYELLYNFKDNMTNKLNNKDIFRKLILSKQNYLDLGNYSNLKTMQHDWDLIRILDYII